jgi:hypothetical protein
MPTLVALALGSAASGCGGASNSETIPPPIYVSPQPNPGQPAVNPGQTPANPGQAPATGQIPPFAQQAPQILSSTQDPNGRGWPNGSSGSEPGISIPATSTDPSYGYTPQNPIRVGGFRDANGSINQSAQGSINQRRYLASLWGPNGETIEYERLGGCCDYPSNLGINGFARIDAYAITWAGRPPGVPPVYLYLDFYEVAPLQVPMGLTTRAPAAPTGPGWVVSPPRPERGNDLAS